MQFTRMKQEEWPNETVWVTKLHGVTFGLKDGERLDAIFGTFVRQGRMIEWYTSAYEEQGVSSVWSELYDDLAEVKRQGRYTPRKRAA